ncbi:MAG: LysR family transcriptional regulator [Microbacteriaceae bacterium]|nr:LysR family transcriptional regulator [Burkholderiaceae bacterium]
MSPELLPAISAFACVARHASFTRAAVELGVSPSALSQTLKTLETRLGVRLLDRTTRRVGVTEIGQRFLAEAQVGLAALSAALVGLDESRDEAVGLLRLNVSRAAADIVLLPLLADFMATYPRITLEVVCNDSSVDLVAGKFDAGIRIGELLALDTVAVPLGKALRLATFAAPAYLLGREAPQQPADLQAHRCLNFRFADNGALYRWEYAQPDGTIFEVETAGGLVSNDGSYLLAAARAGVGIGCSFEAHVQADFEAGRLVPLLQPWWPRFAPFHLYYASRHHVPRKLRVFIAILQLRFGA